MVVHAYAAVDHWAVVILLQHAYVALSAVVCSVGAHDLTRETVRVLWDFLVFVVFRYLLQQCLVMGIKYAEIV